MTKGQIHIGVGGSMSKPMMCEHKDCKEQGRDYIRKHRWLLRLLGDEWWDEPIHLCNEHAKGYKLWDSRAKNK